MWSTNDRHGMLLLPLTGQPAPHSHAHARRFQIFTQLTAQTTKQLMHPEGSALPQAGMDADADTARFSWLVAAAADARGATPPKAAAQKHGQDKDDATVRRTIE